MIIQLLSDQDGKPTYALTSNGNLMVWSLSNLPFGGDEYKFNYLPDNSQPNVTPALGCFLKLVRAKQTEPASERLADLMISRLQPAFGNFSVRESADKLEFTVTEGTNTAKIVLTNIRTAPEGSEYTGNFIGLIRACKTAQEFKGWWRESDKVIGFSG